MKFPRNAKPFAGQLDAAPFAGVFFVLLIFVALGNNLIFTPGVPIRLPEAADLPGTLNPTAVVTVAAGGEFYYDNQVITLERLRARLAEEVRRAREPLTLVVQADRDVRYEVLVQLGLLAHDAGIKDALLATRPRLSPQPPPGPSP